MSEKKRWYGTKPEKCDICTKPLESEFVDGRSVKGYWAIMCRSCHKLFGVGLGTGKGQRYNLATLEKVEG